MIGYFCTFRFRDGKHACATKPSGGDAEVSMAGFGASALYWIASGVGLYLIGYVLVRWRKSARACYPMPFRRRKGYLSGLLFSLIVMVVPLSLRPNNCAGCALAAAPDMVASLISN
tara:strand:- start:1373 stop:1720 length:348 start_codon:yes stop_codon:yes gene_type:complete